MIQIGADRIHVWLVDVGIGGVAVLAPRLPPAGLLRISFRVGPDAGFMDLDGVVVHSQPRGSESLWGVELHGADPGTRTRLRDYVRGHRPRSD